MNEQVEKMLEKLVGILEGAEGSSTEEMGVLLGGVYDGIVGPYRPIINSVPAVVDKLASDLTPVGLSIINLMNTLRADKNIAEAIEKGNSIKASQRMKLLKAYMKAGFKRNEAMSLLLNDIAYSKAAIQNVSEKAGKLNK